ncbi:MAG: prolyl-tRNA synthetase associated domain-containing protein, partial [Clostridiales bacterium]|nr:prolyl-tRNA synthetase associated domain-containing protein [Clostridiales bacterium]
LNDKDHIVHAALDSDLLKEEKLLIHPNINTASLAVRTQDILKFIISLGYDYKLIEAEKENK